MMGRGPSWGFVIARWWTRIALVIAVAVFWWVLWRVL